MDLCISGRCRSPACYVDWLRDHATLLSTPLRCEPVYRLRKTSPHGLAPPVVPIIRCSLFVLSMVVSCIISGGPQPYLSLFHTVLFRYGARVEFPDGFVLEEVAATDLTVALVRTPVTRLQADDVRETPFATATTTRCKKEYGREQQGKY